MRFLCILSEITEEKECQPSRANICAIEEEQTQTLSKKTC